MVGVTAALSAGGTILTLTPSEPLLANETYDIRGAVTAVINGELQDLMLVNEWNVIGGGLASGAISADNYNGTTGQASAKTPIYIEFPEYVDGSALVKSYVDNGTPIAVNHMLDLNTGQFVTDDHGTPATNDNGCTAGVCGGDHVSYRVSLPLWLADDHAASANSVTVFVDATNTEGTHVAEELTLKVE
jgi:hypothetical protein